MDNSFKIYISNLIRYTKKVTYHNQFYITIVWKTDDIKDSEIAATIYTSHEYFQATIEIYPCLYEMYKAKKYSEIGDIILHEICHIYFEPLLDFYSDFTSKAMEKSMVYLLETQVQTLRNTVSSLLPNSWYTPKYVNSLAKKLEN